jgi:DASS family divalent anion:Na+ symporter
MLAIFVAAILGLVCQPLPSGAVMMLAVAVSILTRTLQPERALSGFANPTVWLIFCAYILSIGFVKTGLGRRIAYRMIAWLGGSSLGIAYALGLSDLLLAPAMPSATARSGGIIFPIVRSINATLESEPGPTGKRIGDFLILSCFHLGPVTGSIFLTGMAANPLCAELAKSALDLEISWLGWTQAAILPGILYFLLLPLLSYWLTRPKMRRTERAREMGWKAVSQMGRISGSEKLLIAVFLLAMLGWGTGFYTNLSATTVALGGVGILLIFRVVRWKDVLREQAAWDTLIWFGAIVGLATGLSDLGFIAWLTGQLSTAFAGWAWLTTFVALGLAYIYSHYAFATATGHAAAAYVPFVTAAVAAGAPPMMVAICFGIFSNLMWGLTEYGGGPGPIWFGLGYFERPRFYRLNLVIVTANVTILFVVGVFWWKFIGLW